MNNNTQGSSSRTNIFNNISETTLTNIPPFVLSSDNRANDNLQRLNTFLGTLSRTLERSASQQARRLRHNGLNQIVSTFHRRDNPWDMLSSDDDDDDEPRFHALQHRHFMEDVIRRHYGILDLRRDLETMEMSTQTRINTQLLEEDVFQDDGQRLDPEDIEYIKTHIVRRGFGVTGLETYKKLAKAGMTRRHVSDSDDFLIKLLRNYIQLEEEEAEMDKFISCLPTLERLHSICGVTHVHMNQIKEVVMKRFLIEIWSRHLIATDGPKYERLVNKLLPLAIEFFDNITTQMAAEISSECDTILRELKQEKFNVVNYETNRGFLAHYCQAYRDWQNLVMFQSSELH